MSDLEGLTRRLLIQNKTDEEILKRLVQEYTDFKDIDKEQAYTFANAVLTECKKSDISKVSEPFIKDLLGINRASVTVGKQGVGCRGVGDFFVHKLIAELSETNILSKSLKKFISN